MAPATGRSSVEEMDAIRSTAFVLVRRATTNTASSNVAMGAGARSPNHINNKGFFALFGLLGAAMVIASIWFFFWAKNGGFIWRETDWEDYKTTVLRRKDKNGKTLSNATPRTNLGQHSVAGTFDIEKNAVGGNDNRRNQNGKRPAQMGMRENSDEDVRAYRHERPAKVGGLNRQHDGSHFDYSTTDGSDIVSNNSRVHLTPHKSMPAPTTELRKKGFLERKRERKQMKRNDKDKKPNKASLTPLRTVTPRVRPVERRAPPSVTEMSSVPDINPRHGGGQNMHGSYFAQYRPEHTAPQIPRHSSPRRSYANSPSHSRQPSPVKSTRQPRPPGSYDAYSDAETSDRASAIYNTEHIPQFSRGTGGFRRDGGYGDRRDSLSDSDGDLGRMR